MSRLTRNINTRKFHKSMAKLRDLLGRCNKQDFLQGIWAVSQLQSKQNINVKPYLNYPEEAATSDMGSPYAAYKWNLESLLLLALEISRVDTIKNNEPLYNCGEFSTISMALNLLRRAENAEWGALPPEQNIFLELHRIGHQQFGWQRGFATQERLYRFAFLYGKGRAGEYFSDAYGLKVEEFLQAGFMLNALLSNLPWTKVPEFSDHGLDNVKLSSALSLLCRSIEDIADEIRANSLNFAGSNLKRIAYMPSALRKRPVISDHAGKIIISPLPELIMYRISAGLYYDFIQSGQDTINDINGRFEEYARLLIGSFYPEVELLPSQRYGTKKISFDTPDVLLKAEGTINIVFECKAAKLTHEAQFADNPIADADKAYKQLIKAVVQIWRFFSHARRGIYTGQQVSGQAHGIVLTMDAWAQMSELIQDQIIDAARSSIVGDGQITDEDMRHVIFCPIQDLVDVMFISKFGDIEMTLTALETDKYKGWGLREARKDLNIEENASAFPLSIEELLPWWTRFQRGK